MGSDDLGRWGEDRAEQYLLDEGFRIQTKNYQTPVGQCDILARDSGAIVFVEVKTRSSHQFGSPISAITYQKRQQLRRVARYYLSKNENSSPCRFDVIGITLQDEGTEINHVVNAFGETE